MRKKQYYSDEEKEKINQKILKHQDNLGKLKEKQVDYETYDEALINYLPVHQREYAKGPNYIFLLVQFKLFLEKLNFHENRQALKLAKENFDNYCETMIQEKICLHAHSSK